MLQLINLSTQSKQTMSQEDGVRLNPLVSNPEETIKQLQEESAQSMKMALFGTTKEEDETGEE